MLLFFPSFVRGEIIDEPPSRFASRREEAKDAEEEKREEIWELFLRLSVISWEL